MKKLMVVAFAMGLGAVQAATYYVVPAGTEGNNPTAPYDSWEKAANEPALAVEQAKQQNDVVLVRKGEYAVTQMMLFQAHGVTIRSCDPATGEATAPEETVFDLSGVTDGYGIKSPSKSNVVVDGFTFRNKGGSNGCIYMYGASSFRLQNCLFTNNVGSASGMALESFLSGGGVVSNCTFACNETSGSGGGAIYTQQNESSDEYVTLRGCTFRKNYVRNNDAKGGAVFAVRCLHAIDCWFEDNGCTKADGTVTGIGGSMHVGLTPHLSGCTFTGQATATYGGALDCRPENVRFARGIVTNCTFKSIVFTGTYGVLHMNTFGADVRDCTFEDITTGRSVLFTEGTDGAYIRNCLFKPLAGGGSVLMTHNSKLVRLENCTIDNQVICHNNATSSSNEWVNCVLSGTKPTASENHRQIYENCLFGNPGFVSQSRGDYRLRSDSEGVDAAKPLDWQEGAKDIRGRDRVVGAGPDIGCYEHQPDDVDFHSVVRVVPTEAEKSGEWADAYTDLQEAVDAAPEEALVWLKSGTYALTEETVVESRTLTIRSCNPETRALDPEGTVLDGGGAVRAFVLHNGPTVPGGDAYVPAEYHPVEVAGFTFRNCKTTAGDGQHEAGKGGAIWMRGTAKTSSQTPSVVRNCRFENCTADDGGGVWMAGGALVDCTLTNCASTVGDGGGAHLAYVSTSTNRGDVRNAPRTPNWYIGTFIGCTFDRCTAKKAGGGLRPGDGMQNAIVWDCTFVDCTAESSGGSGGAYRGAFNGCRFIRCRAGNANALGSAEMTVRDAVFTGCSGGYGCVFGSDAADFYNCVFTNNSMTAMYGKHNIDHCLIAGNAGGGFNMYVGGGLIVNSTIANNTGSGISSSHAGQNCQAVVVNSIVTGNSTDYSFQSGGSLTATNSLFAATHAPAANVSFDNCFYGKAPGFRDAAHFDYSLRPGAYAREKGLKLGYTAVSTDLAGNPRLVNRDGVANVPDALPDLGCYECQEMTPGFLLFMR